jgi:hypothetical protein
MICLPRFEVRRLLSNVSIESSLLGALPEHELKIVKTASFCGLPVSIPTALIALAFSSH